MLSLESAVSVCGITSIFYPIPGGKEEHLVKRIDIHLSIGKRYTIMKEPLESFKLLRVLFPK